MKVRIKLSHFKAVSLARADKNELRWFLRGIWLDFAKNRIMATDRQVLMVTLPEKGMEIEIPPTRHTHLNIPAAAVEQILKIADKNSEWLMIESDNETDAVITDGAARISFEFDKSEMPDIDRFVRMDCSCQKQDAGFFGELFNARYLWKAAKAAVILQNHLPVMRFYPDLCEDRAHPAANIVLNGEMLMLVMPTRVNGIKPPSLDWEAQTGQAA